MDFSEKYRKIYNLGEKEISLIKSKILANLGNADFLNDDLTDFIKAPSKNIRILFGILYSKANNMQINETILTYLGTIELLHSASLVHDDIIDSSVQRRGQSSLNATYGNHIAVVAGDYILSAALKYIAQINSQKLTSLLAETIEKMCRGELKQYYLKGKIPTMEEYIEKTYLKTGSLFEATLAGINIINMGKEDFESQNFAKNFGIAFQLKNDIFNLFNTKIDSDINNGIYTAAIIYSGNPKDYTSGIEKTVRLLDNYIDKAKVCLSGIKENKYKTALLELLELIRYE